MNRSARKVDRLMKIQALLLAYPEGLTAAELARRLGVHRSTAYRDLQDLSHLCPLTEEDGRFFINRSAYEVKVGLTLHEAMALYLAARMMVARTDRQNPHGAAALRKLGLALRDLAPRIAAHMRTSADLLEEAARRQDPVYLEVLEKLTLAWAEGRKVRVWHWHEGSRQVYEYVFAPYFLEPYPVGRTTHVIGWREPPGALRTFKVERIRRVEFLAERYEIPADFDPRSLLEKAWGIWFAEGEPAEVVLRFHPRVAHRVRETTWHPTETLEEDRDGYLIWRAQVAEPREMLPWIRGWGADVEVLRPEGLREELKAEARALAERYGWSVEPEGGSNARDSIVDDFFGG